MQGYVVDVKYLSKVEDYRREAEQARLVQQAKAEQQPEPKKSRWPLFFRPQLAR